MQERSKFSRKDHKVVNGVCRILTQSNGTKHSVRVGTWLVTPVPLPYKTNRPETPVETSLYTTSFVPYSHLFSIKGFLSVTQDSTSSIFPTIVPFCVSLGDTCDTVPLLYLCQSPTRVLSGSDGERILSVQGRQESFQGFSVSVVYLNQKSFHRREGTRVDVGVSLYDSLL